MTIVLTIVSLQVRGKSNIKLLPIALYIKFNFQLKEMP